MGRRRLTDEERAEREAAYRAKHPNKRGCQSRTILLAKQLVEQYTNGKTMPELGKEHGISHERVRQLLAREGVTAKNTLGGRSLKALINKRYAIDREKSKEERCFNTYGCSYEEAKNINDGLNFSQKGTTTCKYYRQKRNAIVRGIGWDISLLDWWLIWDESGKWNARGQGGYVMARVGDTGSYNKDNVEIITAAQNSSDQYIQKPWKERWPNGHPHHVRKIHCEKGYPNESNQK